MKSSKAAYFFSSHHDIQRARVRQLNPKKGHFREVAHAAMRVSRRFFKKTCSGTSVVLIAIFDKQ
ncbi:MAG: hypothetical protein Q8N89_13390, partial [Azonexus sp.]|nr:hypothetical protein [Azonexus sp.]